MAEGAPFIRIRGLEKSFGSAKVLRGVDLDVGRGETLVLLGGSGGGKSVLIKHILGLLCPDAGSVEIDGEHICRMSERQQATVRRKIGMMFQNGALFDSLSVFENIAFPLREGGMKNPELISEKVHAALEIVRLPDQAEKMPADLSGGMRKRVALARAVVDRPDCVLYDEPHAGLDPITGDKIDHLIKDLQRDHGITNIVITHEMRSVPRIADRVIFMKDGQIYWQGTPQEFEKTDDSLLQDFQNGISENSWSPRSRNVAEASRP